MSSMLIASSDTIRRLLPAAGVLAVLLAVLLLPADAVFVAAMGGLTGLAVLVGQLRRSVNLG